MPLSRINSGFTLIEVLVISPIVILFIGAFVALVIGLTGESLQLREKNSMTYDLQASLGEIESNAARATQFLATTGAIANVKQGSDNSTGAAFTSTNASAPDSLIFTAIATDRSQFDSTRSIVYIGSGACDSSNPVYPYTTVYFVANGSLYKRQILSSLTACTTPFQKGTCSSTVMASSPPAYCMATDDLLMDNVSGLSITYYANGVVTSDPTVANSIKASLTSSRSVGGQTITYTSDLQVTGTNVGAGS